MSEPERTRPFFPKDNAVDLDSVDWKTRYNEYKNKRDWDEKRDFVGIKRLGDSYHFLDPFFKFQSVPEEDRFFEKFWYPFFCGIGFPIVYLTVMKWANRPVTTGIVPALLSSVFGVGIGYGAYVNMQNKARDRDAVLMHYMLLHENDFPRIERKKFGQILKDWYPHRSMDYEAQKD